MRPDILFPVFAPLSSLAGIGPRLEKLMEKLVGGHVVDLLWHLPREVIDRSATPSIAETYSGQMATLRVIVDRHIAPPTKQRPHRVICRDDTGTLTLIFFRGDQAWLNRQLPPGEERLISGRIEYFQGAPQIAHPDYMVAPEQAQQIPKKEAVYPLAAGITQKVMIKATQNALSKAPELNEWLDPEFKKREAFPDWKQAVLQAHKPETTEALEGIDAARRRLAFDELLASQLAVAITRAQAKKRQGRSIEGDKSSI